MKVVHDFKIISSFLFVSTLISCGGGGESNSQPPASIAPPVQDINEDPDEIIFEDINFSQISSQSALNSNKVNQIQTVDAIGEFRVPSSGMSFSGNIAISVAAGDPDGIAAVYVGSPNTQKALVLCSSNCGTEFEKVVSGVSASGLGLSNGTNRLELLVQDELQNSLIVDAVTFTWRLDSISGLEVVREPGIIDVTWSPLSGYLRYNLYIKKTGTTAQDGSFIPISPEKSQFLSIAGSSFRINDVLDGDQFDIQVKGVSTGGESASSSTITVLPLEGTGNEPPVAVSDNFEGNEDSMIQGNLLSNDSDVNDTDVLELVTQPIQATSNGSLSLNSNGSFTYIPNANFNGEDSFIYQVEDGRNGTAQAGVNLKILPINDAPIASPDTYSTEEDIELSVAAPGVLGNDSDIEAQNLVVLSAQGENENSGSISINPDGSFNYTPPTNFSGDDQFTYLIADTEGVTATSTITISVGAENDPPVAVNDQYTATEDETLSVSSDEGILANDTDSDDDASTLTVSLLSSVSNGRLSLAGDGSFTYIPEANFFGTDSFTYSVTDPSGAMSQATVIITVVEGNDPPIANDDSYQANENESLTVDAERGLLSNDTDPEDADISVNGLFSEPRNGTVDVSADGSFTYTPSTDFVGTDTFSYEVTDGITVSIGSVEIVVVAVNRPPIAENDEISVNANSEIRISPLDNDQDPEGGELLLVSAEAENGSVVISDNIIIYTPNEDFEGSDNINYTVSDPEGNTASATILVEVTAARTPPLAVDDEVTVDSNSEVSISPLENDSDPNDESLIIISAEAQNGEVRITGTNLVYSSNIGFSGLDTITYTIENTSGLSATAVVTVTVNEINNTTPVANPDTFTVDEGQTATVDVLSNDRDEDGDPLTISSANLVDSSQGSVDINGANIVYTPASDVTGTVVINYTINDGTADSNQTTLTITVTPAEDTNSAPIANNDSASATAGNSVTINVISNDTDADNDTLSLQSANITSGTGTLSTSGNNVIVDIGAASSDIVVSYVVSDGQLTATGTLSITVAEAALTGSHDLDGDGVDDLTISANGSDYDITLPATVESVYYIDGDGNYVQVEPQSDGTYLITVNGTSSPTAFKVKLPTKNDRSISNVVIISELFFVSNGQIQSINLASVADPSPKLQLNAPVTVTTEVSNAEVADTWIMTVPAFEGPISSRYITGDKLVLNSDNSGTLIETTRGRNSTEQVLTWSTSGSQINYSVAETSVNGSIDDLWLLGFITFEERQTYISTNGTEDIVYYVSIPSAAFTVTSKVPHYMEGTLDDTIRYRAPTALGPDSTPGDPSDDPTYDSNTSQELRLLNLSNSPIYDFNTITNWTTSYQILPFPYLDDNGYFDSWGHEQFDFASDFTGTTVEFSGLGFENPPSSEITVSSWVFESDDALTVNLSNGWIGKYYWLSTSDNFDAVFAEFEDSSTSKVYTYYGYMLEQENIAAGVFANFISTGRDADSTYSGDAYLESSFALTDKSDRNTDKTLIETEQFGFYFYTSDDQIAESPIFPAKRIYGQTSGNPIDEEFYWQELTGSPINIELTARSSISATSASYKASYSRCTPNSQECFIWRKRIWQPLWITDPQPNSTSNQYRLWVLEREFIHSSSWDGATPDFSDSSDVSGNIRPRLNFYDIQLAAPNAPNSILFNLAPSQTSDTVYLTKNSSANFIDVLSNDFDPESDALTILSINADSGSAGVSADNLYITYQTVADFTGTVSATYSFSDSINEVTGYITFDISDDSDNDGVPDNQEIADGSSISNEYSFLDSDIDGVPDYFEVGGFGYNENTFVDSGGEALDSDGDGVIDYIEAYPGENDLPDWDISSWSVDTSESYPLAKSGGTADDRFGYRTLLSDNYLVASLINSGTEQGKVLVWYDDNHDGDFSDETPEEINAPIPASNDRFGISLAMDEDVLVIGSVFSTNDNGSVYIYVDSDQDGQFSDESPQELTGAAGESFGESLSFDDDSLLVGAPKGNSGNGIAYLYIDTDNDFDFVEEIASRQAITASDGALNDQFGISVVIYNDLLIVGSHFDDDNGTNSGSVYIYRDTDFDGNFEEEIATTEQKLVPTDGDSGDQFGWSLDFDKATLVVGAHRHSDTGAAYVYSDIDNDSNFTNNLQQKLMPSDGDTNDFYGYSVKIERESIVIGSPYHDISDLANLNEGAAYLYIDKDNDGFFVEERELQIFASDAASSDLFGHAVAISSGRVVAGAIGNDVSSNNDQGSVYVFEGYGLLYTTDDLISIPCTEYANDEEHNYECDTPAKDADGDNITYSIAGGTDSAKFTIDSATGQLSFLSAVDFDSPTDSDADNYYEVNIKASDSTDGSVVPVRVKVGSLFSKGYYEIVNSSGNDYSSNSVIEASDGSIYFVGTYDNSSSTDFVINKIVGNALTTKIEDVQATADDFAYDVLEQSDGNLVVVGDSNNETSLTLLQYSPGGTALNTNFSADGIVLQTFNGTARTAFSVIEQQDGKLVTAGSNTDGGKDFVVARYNTDGSLDLTNFNNPNGFITQDGPEALDDIAYDLIQQHDGKLVVVGESKTGAGSDHMIIRLNADGTLDASFDTNGRLTISDGGQESAFSVIEQSNGKLVVAGYQLNGTDEDIHIARINSADGSPDPTFATDGTLTLDFGGDQERARQIIQTSDGKLTFVGYSNSAGENKDVVVAQLNDDGTLNTDFGDSNGYVFIRLGTGDDLGYSITETADNKLLITGTTFNGNEQDAFVIRMDLYGNFDEGADTDGDGVPDIVETTDGTAINDSSAYKDSDNDGVPDYIEIQEGTDFSDTTDYVDDDGDLVPNYFEASGDGYVQGLYVDFFGDPVDSNYNLIIDYLDSFNAIPSDISLSASSVYENQPINTSIGSLNTTDSDIGDRHTYSLSCSTPGADDGAVALNSSILETNSVYNHEESNDLSVCIRTTDSFGQSFDKNFTITITDVNESPTGVSLSPTNIDEGQNTGSTIGALVTSDEDIVSGDTHTYTITCSSPGTDDADVAVSGSNLITNTVYDYDTKTSLSVCVRTTDTGGLTFDQDLTVTINEVAANATPTAVATIASKYTNVAGSTVTLDGSGSSDAETATSNLIYSWTQTDSTGTTITLDDNTAQQPTFTAPSLAYAQSFSFGLEVTDEGGQTSSTSSVKFSVIPSISQAINDTGFIQCGDASSSNSLDCSSASPDGQDGDYGRDVDAADDNDGVKGFSFTKLDSSGDPVAHSTTFAEGLRCVRDNVTGLIWEVKTNDGGRQDKGNTYSWYDSSSLTNGGNSGRSDFGACSDTGNCDTEKYISELNGASLCGFTNWRLPTTEELESIMDLSGAVSAVDTDYFKNDGSTSYWTSDTSFSAEVPSAYAVTVSSIDGSVNQSSKSSENAAVRAVMSEN